VAVNQGIEEELDELCDLACLYLSPAEKEQIAGQLNAILRLVSQIQKVETDGVEPTFYLAAQPVHFRKDQVEPSFIRTRFSGTRSTAASAISVFPALPGMSLRKYSAGITAPSTKGAV